MISFPASPTDGQVYNPGPPAPIYIYKQSINAWQKQSTGPQWLLVVNGDLPLGIMASPDGLPLYVVQ